MFRDEQVDGPFRRMRHDHWFEPREGGTLMRDRFEVSVFPVFDTLVLVPYLRRFLRERNEHLRAVPRAGLPTPAEPERPARPRRTRLMTATRRVWRGHVGWPSKRGFSRVAPSMTVTRHVRRRHVR
jgi:hypothetical protein